MAQGCDDAGSSGARPPLGGILLTGGASSRMGRNKALLRVDGIELARRIAALLAQVAEPSIEVGPGHSGLPAVIETPPSGGPLVAVAAGAQALRAAGHRSGAIVLACDLPLLSLAVLEGLVGWPGTASVLPVIGGIAQPLCARWSATDLGDAIDSAARGVRSLHDHPRRDHAVLADEHAWAAIDELTAFADLDAPDDISRLGIRERIEWGH